MKANRLFHFAGWSAYVNVAANIIGFVSLFVFFAVGGPAGIINDSSNIFFSLSLIPLALMWHYLHRSIFPSLSLVVTAIGILALIVATILQALLVLSVVELEQTLRSVLVANARFTSTKFSFGMIHFHRDHGYEISLYLRPCSRRGECIFLSR